MTKAVVSLLMLSVSLQLSVSCARANAGTVTLRSHASVEGETIRLGDLFDGARDAAGKAVATAPRLGAKMIIGTIDLQTLAQSNGLSWFPEKRDAHIVVERSGMAVPVSAIILGLERQLGPGKQVDLDPSNATFEVPAHAPTTVSVDQLAVDPRTGRLTAEVSAPAGSDEPQHIRVTGRVRATVEVPVLRRAVLPGEVVRQRDVSYAALPADQLSNTVVADPAKIVGRVARTVIRPDLPVHASDIQLNAVVRKGDLVRVAVDLPGLDVTAQGKALEDGALGQSIRVLNTTSNITLEATVRGAGEVRVTPGSAP